MDPNQLITIQLQLTRSHAAILYSLIERGEIEFAAPEKLSDEAFHEAVAVSHKARVAIECAEVVGPLADNAILGVLPKRDAEHIALRGGELPLRRRPFSTGGRS